MPIVNAFFPIRRTMGKLTFYMMDGKNYVRKKSSLSAKRVKKNQQFARTRYYAGLMAVASGIGSQTYQALPPRWRQSWMYRAFTGEAMQLLKAGKTRDEVTDILWQLYVEPVPKSIDKQPAKTGNKKRAYKKKDVDYWHRKSARAAKRKAQQEKLHYYAGLMSRASAIGSKVYQLVPPLQRKRYLYNKLTGFAMQLLHEGYEDVEARLKLTKVIHGVSKPEKKKSLFVIPYTADVLRHRLKQRLRKAKATIPIFTLFSYSSVEKEYKSP